MANAYDLSVQFTAVDNLTRPIQRMTNSVARASDRMTQSIKEVSRASQDLRNAFSSTARSALRFGVITGGVLGSALLFITKQFSKIEEAEAAFTPLLGSAKAAEEAVKKLNDQAVRTPFRFEQLAAAGTTMLSTGVVSARELTGVLDMLGNVAGGNADRLNRIALVYSQVIGLGKANTRDLNQFVDAGVPILLLLQKLPELANKTTAEIRSMAEAGVLTSSLVTRALTSATTGTGMFAGAMELGAKTTKGFFNQLVNNIQLIAAAIGKATTGPIKEMIVELNNFAVSVREMFEGDEGQKKLEAFGKEFRDMLGSLKVGAKFLRDNWKQILKFVTVLTVLIATLKVLNIVLLATNLIMKTNAFGLVVAGVAALIVAITALWAWWGDLNSSTKIFIATLGALATVIGAVTAAKWLWVAASTAFTKGLKLLRAGVLAFSIALWANPLVWFVGAVVAGTAAIVAMIYYFDEIKDRWNKTSQAFKAGAMVFLGPLFAIAFVVDKIIKSITWLGRKLGLIDEIPDMGADFRFFKEDNSANDGVFNADTGFSDFASMTTPQDRNSESISREISEKNNNLNINLRDETGRAVVDNNGVPVDNYFMPRTGAFN